MADLAQPALRRRQLPRGLLGLLQLPLEAAGLELRHLVVVVVVVAVVVEVEVVGVVVVVGV